MAKEQPKAKAGKPSRFVLPEYSWPALAAAIALIAEVVVLQLWRLSSGIPIEFAGDAVFSETVVKGMVENGHLWINAHLGAPSVMNLLDYPSADLVHYAAIRVLALLTGGWANGYNAYFILGFPLAAASAAWVIRRLSVAGPLAVMGGVLYAFMPYHFFRSAYHIYLSAYYLVPLVVWLAIELAGDRPPLISGESHRLAELEVWRTPSVWVPLIICLLLGSSGVYYAFFGGFFLVVGATIGWWRTRERWRFAAVGVLLACVALSGAIDLAPFVWHSHVAGPNTEVGQRAAGEAELYGFKLANTLLPPPDDRIPALASIRAEYQGIILNLFGNVFANEAEYTSLGLLGAIGFLALLWWSIARPRPQDRDTPDAAFAMAALNLAGVLLATVGGFGVMLALYFAEIRAYNRIIAYLGFFAFAAFPMLLDRLRSRDGQPVAPAVVWVLAALFLFFGIFEQTVSSDVPDYSGIRTSWTGTSAFVGQVQSELPEGAMVLQLPFVPFPENPPVVAMVDYDHFKPYLASTSSIHWSYGAMRGRDDAEWARVNSAKSPADLVSAARAKGFAGIWVDCAGYQDGGRSIVQSLMQASGSEVQQSSDRRYAFVKL